MKGLCVSILWLAGVCLLAQSAPVAGAPTPLANLLDEARKNNPEIRASMHGAHAATYGAKQASALPDTQLMLQNLSVGSPKLLAGYTNSDFAYVGLGVAQEFPGSGKRGLRSKVASAQADVMTAQSQSVSRTVVEQVKTAYFKLAYLQATLDTLERDDQALGEIEQIAESRYRVGRGNQQEVLKAQLQHTKILQDISMHHREQAEGQIMLKRMLGRAQESPDIVPELLQQRPMPASVGDLQQQAAQGNADVKIRELAVRKTELQTQLAHKEFNPDFALQYMYQNTDRKFRDYYMLTFSVTLPNRGRRKAELGEANAMQRAAAAELEAEVQRREAEVKEQYTLASTAAEQLKIYREGLMPQAEAAFRAGLAAYQSNRLDFEPVLSSFRDLLDFQEQYQKQLSEYESALARLESLTGVTLP